MNILVLTFESFRENESQQLPDSQIARTKGIHQHVVVVAKDKAALVDVLAMLKGGIRSNGSHHRRGLKADMHLHNERASNGPSANLSPCVLQLDPPPGVPALFCDVE